MTEVFKLIDLAIHWTPLAAAVLFTVFVFSDLARTAINMTDFMLNGLEVLISVYVRITLWALLCLVEALAWLLRQLLAVA